MAGIGANSLGAIQNPGSPSGRLESFPVQGAFSCQPIPKPAPDSCVDHGLFLTLRAIRRQVAAMPNELYLVRLIHHATRRPFPGERLWTATQLIQAAIVRFLRARNREGCDIYIRPYADDRNAGYILLDLDHADAAVLETMHANGHEPCVVLQTSPRHLQAWIRISAAPLEPTVATAIGRWLAHTYWGDLASTDWRHLGRLAGFTNQKPQRRTSIGYAPWVKIVYARVGLARSAEALLQSVMHLPAPTQRQSPAAISANGSGHVRLPPVAPLSIGAAEAAEIYQRWTHRWRIAERFTPPDWSIVDLWIARKLLSQGMPTERVQHVLRLGSPHFPRRHTDPDDYLRRTVARAGSGSFPASATASLHARESPARAAQCVTGPLGNQAMDCSPHG